PPDGQPGRMKLHLYATATPRRDAALQSDMIIHEYAHGVSTRLTGGPANSDCLSSGEAAAMGEGWSDFFAIALRMKATDKRSKEMAFGAWLSGKRTMRTYLYSTNPATNPTTYEYLEKPDWQEAHAAGEVWANTLYEMYWNLVEATGKFNPD